MIPSPQANNRYLTYSYSLAARHSQARIYPLNSQLAAFIPRLIEKTKNCLPYDGWWILLDA
jgi:hypothetical protein